MKFSRISAFSIITLTSAVVSGGSASASVCSPSVSTLSEMRQALTAGVGCETLTVTLTADITVTGGQLEFVSEADLVLQSDGTTRTLSGDQSNRILLVGTDADSDGLLDTGASLPLPTLTLNDLRFIDGAPSSNDQSSWNSDGGRGGGAVYARRGVFVNDSEFVDNLFPTASVGGGGAYFEEGPVEIRNTRFEDNEGYSGGAVRVNHTRVAADELCLHLEGVTVTQNRSSGPGGGVYVQCDGTEGLVTVENSSFVDNETTGASSSAGGLFTTAQAVTITDSLFDGNIAAGYGGGAMNISDGTLIVEGSTFVDNQANDATNGQGGAIRTFRPSVTISNSTFSGNSARAGGDTIYSGRNNAVNSLTHVTIIGGGTGHAILTGAGTSTLDIEASVIIDSAGGCDGLGTLTVNHSVISASGCANPDSGSNNWIDGTDGTWSNSWLADIADNGGPTPTRLPSTDQPTVFRRVPVANDVCADLAGVDQRGEARPGRRGETNCWAGAVELVVNDPLTVTASSHSLTAGDAVPTITGTPSVDGVTIDGMTCSTTYTASSPAGTYPATCTGGSAYRYDITHVAGTVTVAAPPTTTTAPTTTVAPTTTTVALAPVAPNAGLQAGSQLVTLDGVEVPVTLTRDANTVTLTGDGFGMSLVGLDENQTPGELDPDGNLILEAGGFTRVTGSGFAPDTDVKVYLFSNPVLLGTVRTDATGAFDATMPVPADTPSGVHTVQANGFTTDGKIRSMNLGVVIPAPSVTLPATGGNTGALGIALALGATGLIGLIASRRRQLT